MLGKLASWPGSESRVNLMRRQDYPAAGDVVAGSAPRWLLDERQPGPGYSIVASKESDYADC